LSKVNIIQIGQGSVKLLLKWKGWQVFSDTVYLHSVTARTLLVCIFIPSYETVAYYQSQMIIHSCLLYSMKFHLLRVLWSVVFSYLFVLF